MRETLSTTLTLYLDSIFKRKGREGVGREGKGKEKGGEIGVFSIQSFPKLEGFIC